ncbi:MAG: 5'/3'-nucleotidase SurE [Bacteroidales bacterium]|nr:5'/3'-nucleotidase SurE [Bacteroidales bacterium]
MARKLILVSNDDGYLAPGLRVLMTVAAEFGEVVAVAPDRAQSTTSHALTMREPLFVSKKEETADWSLYACSGLPADCIKFAMHEVVSRKPDLILSGINHGENASCSALYSGTVAVAAEGCLHHVPAIAFSVASPDQQADVSPYIPVVREIIRKVLQDGLPTGSCLNVNIPEVPAAELRGIRLCRQARGYWNEEYCRHEDPSGRPYYWLSGFFVNNEPEAEDTDVWAGTHGYVSMVPMQADMSDYAALDALNAAWPDWRQVGK